MTWEVSRLGKCNDIVVVHFSERSTTLSATLVPETIYRGSEGEEKLPLVESVGNLTDILSPSTEIEPLR